MVCRWLAIGVKWRTYGILEKKNSTFSEIKHMLSAFFLPAWYTYPRVNRPRKQTLFVPASLRMYVQSPTHIVRR